jgi:peptidoglycan/LPS O-acetylase OafA/YrhL
MRSNGFDVLRLVAAAMVIFGHAYPLTGNVAPGLFANGVQTVGVKIFFVISGYLITKSWQSDPNMVRFWMKRALRIIPGLACLCLLTVFILGPLVTSLSLRGYISNPMTRQYFWNLAFYPMYGLPGVFQGNVYGPPVNGSLWSLPVEVAMYAGVPMIISRSPTFYKVCVPLIAAGLLVADILFVRVWPFPKPIVFWGTSLSSTLDVAFYFYAGSTVAVHRLERFANLPVAIVLFVLAFLFISSYIWSEVALAVVLPCVVVAFGLTRITPLQGILDGRDYSYGLYLYGFVVQQSVIFVAGPLTPVLNALISFPCALLFAVGSWHMVEKRAMSIKPRRAAGRLRTYPEGSPPVTSGSNANRANFPGR